VRICMLAGMRGRHLRVPSANGPAIQPGGRVIGHLGRAGAAGVKPSSDTRLQRQIAPLQAHVHGVVRRPSTEGCGSFRS
jgi:hypothetical protein